MRSPNKRSRSKSNRPKTLGNIVNRVFDSSGPEGKVRGTPQQIIEKYQVLARDAQLSNDRVAAENFQQHAEHYTRMLAQAQRELQAEQEARRQNNEERNRQPYEDRGNDRGQDRGQQERGNDRGQQDRGQQERGNDRGHDRGQQDRGYNQNGGRRNDQRRQHEDAARETISQDAFSVQDTDSAPDQGTLVETPESKTASDTPVAAPATPEAAAPEADSKPPARTRKPRAPRAPAAKAEPAASAEPAAATDAGEAPKPRRNTRKPRQTADAVADDVTPSAAE